MIPAIVLISIRDDPKGLIFGDAVVGYLLFQHSLI